MGARPVSFDGDTARLDERAGQLIAVAAEQGFPLYSALGENLPRLGRHQDR